MPTQNVDLEKMKQQYVETRFTQIAQDVSSRNNAGTPRRTKRKTDWFGLVAAGAIILIVAAVVLLLR